MNVFMKQENMKTLLQAIETRRGDTTTDCLSHKMKNLINESLFFQKNNRVIMNVFMKLENAKLQPIVIAD